jgi:FkbM family methyltransferase
MSIFSRAARRTFARRAKTGNAAAGTLTREQVILGFELMLGRPPIREGELAEGLRLRDLRELIGYLVRRDEFRSRYAVGAPPQAATRPAPIFLGDRVLCWTHRGQPLYVVPQDVDLTPRILANGAWELHVEQVMLRFARAGDTVIDLGANVGYYTIILCAAVAPKGIVYAFEAHPDLVRLLKATIHVNGFGPLIELHGCAVSDRPGTLTLALSPDHYGSGNVMPGGSDPGYDEGYPIRLQVPAVTLDATLGERVRAVDLMHLDIEGSEPLALRGAQALIERSPGIKIITEWSVTMMAAHVDLAQYVAWLDGLGFRFWLIDRETAQLSPVEQAGLVHLPHCDLLLSRTDPG